MTAATIAAIGIVLYLPVAALLLAVSLRRVDAVFVRDMQRVLRGGHVSGGPEVADLAHPRSRSAVAGVEPRASVSSLAPPAPCHLVGAVSPAPAPTRPPRIPVAGIEDYKPICGASWGSGCWMHGGGMHSCAWPKVACVGNHTCGCGDKS